MNQEKRPCPTCRKEIVKQKGEQYLYCNTCGWTDDPTDRKKLYGAQK